MLAGLRDSASTVANQICEHLDSAITKSQRVDVEEQETIRQKEEQILLQQKRLSRARITGLVAAIVLLSITFTVFTIISNGTVQLPAFIHGVYAVRIGQYGSTLIRL